MPIHTRFAPDATALEIVDDVDLTGRRAVVTGGATGLGAETVRALVSAGADVTIAARRPRTADALVQELRASGSAGTVRTRALDLADLGSVHRFTQEWTGALDVLVANAGILAVPERVLTPAGWELQLATNYLGHFALALGLHQSMREAGSARIVVVSSGAHRSAPFDFDDPQFERRPYDPWAAYGQSKTADVLLAVGARRWTEDGITANAANPGYVLTGLQRHVDDETMRSLGVLDDDGNLTPLSYYKTPQQGAATTVLLATSPLLDGLSGRYFEDNQEAPVVEAEDDRSGGVAAHALDRASADRLWEYGAEALRSR